MLQRGIILLSLGLMSPLFAQFEHISLEHGLSQTTVRCLLQDRQGYLWFGTADGLNKYDGYTFTVYRDDLLNPYSISDEWITALCEDKFGRLWVGTAKGVLHRFDRKNERFVSYPLDDRPAVPRVGGKEPTGSSFVFSFFLDQTITALAADSAALWIGTWRNGVYKLTFALESPPTNNAATLHKNEFIIQNYRHDPADPNSLSDDHIHALCRDRSGALWIGTYGGGLNRFDEKTGIFAHYQHYPANANSLSDNRVLSICEDEAGALWVGVMGGGLNKLVDKNQTTNPLAARFVHYRCDPSNPNSLSDDDVTAILEDRSRNLWVGTLGGGLNRFDRVNERFTHFRHDRFNPQSLGDDDVISIYEDRSGILWIGSQLGNGICKYDRRKERFAHYKNDPTNPQSLSDNIVWSILPAAHRDEIWIGTYRGGLNRFDRKTQHFTHYRHDPADPKSLSQDHIRGLYEDRDGALWVGTFSEGVNKLVFDTAGKKFKAIHYRHDPANPHSLSDNNIRVIYQDRSGTIWIGTFGGGLNRFDAATERFVRYQYHTADTTSLSDNHVYTIYEDRAGALWVGTYGGGLNKVIGKWTENNVRFIRYQHNPADSSSLSDNRVISILEDHAGNLWIGTFGGGLNRLDRDSGKFDRYNVRHGLPSDVIYGILEDRSGNLWFSTNHGLARFNPHTRLCKNFDERDGLQSKEFSGSAYAQSSNGEMFFGGVNGLNAFFPDSIKDNLHVPPIVISAFKKFNEIAGREIETIDLSYQDNFFSLEFAALDYTDPAQNQYAYCLVGFDKSWVYCGTKRAASYTNLDPGRYTFRLKGTNNDGIWNESGIAIPIIIHPPFWQTWWFHLLTIVLLVGAVMAAHNYRVKQKVTQLLEIERVRKAENERLRKQVADDFHDEFGQQLTNIALFAEIIKRRLNGTSPQTEANLKKISEAAKSLSEGMRDFIWTLDRSKDSLDKVVARLKNFGETLFAKTPIAFQSGEITTDWESVILSMDWKRHLTQIFKEGMKNSLKHADCQNVKFEIKLIGRNLEIVLSDDGKGFENTAAAQGAGLRYMKKRAEKIRGELQVVSQPGHGAEIHFKGQLI